VSDAQGAAFETGAVVLVNAPAASFDAGAAIASVDTSQV
jgi:hypothetical protein